MTPEPYRLPTDAQGRQWWRLDCSICAGQYGCRETTTRPTAPYVCIFCAAQPAPQPRRGTR
jgi:hypothetical protein